MPQVYQTILTVSVAAFVAALGFVVGRITARPDPAGLSVWVWTAIPPALLAALAVNLA